MLHQVLEQCVIRDSVIGGGVVETPGHVAGGTLSLPEKGPNQFLLDGTATVTLPEATGSGRRLRFTFAVAATATATVIAALGTDVLAGVAWMSTTSSDNAVAWRTSATSDKMSFDGTTRGGVIGDMVEVVDILDGTWAVNAALRGTGIYASPFSAS